MSAAAANFLLPHLSVVTAPTVEPVTVAELKAWLRLDGAEDDAMLAGLIGAARAVFEQLTGRTLIDTTYLVQWDALPRVGTYAGACLARELELPRSPLKTSSPVAWIKYLDADGAEQTFSSASYHVETGRDAGRLPRVSLKPSASWPELGLYTGALRCQFTAGYGAAATAVPQEIKVAIKQLAGHFHANPLPVNGGNIVNELPWSLAALIDLHRIRSLA